MAESGVQNIIVTGVGGQGNVLASQIIATAAVDAGFCVSVGETFGASQRGGSVTSQIRVDRKNTYGPLIPKGKATFIIGFEPLETLRTLMEYGNRDTRVIMNLRSNFPFGVLVGDDSYPPVEKIIEVISDNCGGLVPLQATDLALAAGVPVGANMVMTGAFAGSGALSIAPEDYEKIIGGLFSGEILELNLAAFKAGVRAMADFKGRC